MDNVTLPLDAFVRSIGVNRQTPHLFFLGAGASITSGVPSAERCVWEWKQKLFATKNPGLEEQFSELSLVGVQQRIQDWLDKQGGFPVFGTPDEYGFYIEQCYPIASDRRSYFHEKVSSAQPHLGYQLLCHLAENRLVKSVWTTNFDALVAKAAKSFSISAIEVGIDCQHRMSRATRGDELICVSLHGDYRYDYVKNTDTETQRQEKELESELIRQLTESPVVVLGYSGRDVSVMNAFKQAYNDAGPSTLYWCGFGEMDEKSSVWELISAARSAGHQAFYVPTEGFDDTMTRLALHCFKGDSQARVTHIMENIVSRETRQSLPFSVNSLPTTTFIKSNAFELECPSEVFAFELKKWPEERVWASLRGYVDGQNVAVAPFKGKILALGLLDDIRHAFGDNLKGAIERTPVTTADLRFEDGAVVSLMRTALVQAMAEKADLQTDSMREIWTGKVVHTEKYLGERYAVHESVVISLRRIGDQQYLVLMPSLHLESDSGTPVPNEVAKNVKFRILGTQYNNKFNKAINDWRSRLFSDKDVMVTFEYPPGSSSPMRFKVRRSPVFSEIGSAGGNPGGAPPRNVQHLVRHKGISLAEPKLLFSDMGGRRIVRDTHPIRGMLQNRPFDFGLTTSGLVPSVRLGIVCADASKRSLSEFLLRAGQRIHPPRDNPEYVLEYPGFDASYGLPLFVPQPGDNQWIDIPEPSATESLRGSRELANNIIRSIDKLTASSDPHVVLVFIPERWKHFRGYRTEDERFDLHDFVKAYCAEKGVPTQFLEESTLSDSDQCSIWWWLSLAIYTKSMRTPWVLESLDPNSAFVGLGFSLDPTAPRGQRVLVGCSHIYSARGEGLQYRLSKVENPIFRGRNPFLSKDDARRLGETVRQLFFDAHTTLPSRVVMHKRTPFIRDERDGLCEGLGGVDCIEMLEIQTDNALRYVASRYRQGRLDEDNFPVRRGTAVKLDEYSALVWVHGSADAVDSRRRYYQGRKRIPAPLVMRRHMGRSDLATIASEILGLSKMNWNTFDLYTKSPATIHSSNEIARIGALLERFGPRSYDCRLFF